MHTYHSRIYDQKNFHKETGLHKITKSKEYAKNTFVKNQRMNANGRNMGNRVKLFYRR